MNATRPKIPAIKVAALGSSMRNPESRGNIFKPFL